MSLYFHEANLLDVADSAAVLELLDEFSFHVDGKGLPASTKQTLIGNLVALGTCVAYLAESDNEAVGLAICFYGFSTFRNKRLINIHDFYVRKDFQGKGIGSRFLEYIETSNRASCCKVTLEVYKSNVQGIRTYEKNGYTGNTDAQDHDIVYFMHKDI